MAGAENRAPDTGEQRDKFPNDCDHPLEACYDGKCWMCGYVYDSRPPSDPASVLAHLLAEHPDATIAALETLLTSDEATQAAAHTMRFAPLPSHMPPDRSRAYVALTAACRSLRPNTPNEDRDA